MMNSDAARARMIARMMRNDAQLNPQERKRLLQKRAKRELEAKGYGLKKLQGGGFVVFDGETEETISEFETIEQVGRVFGLWGEDVPGTDIDNAGAWTKPPDRDPLTGLDTPETAATREKAES